MKTLSKMHLRTAMAVGDAIRARTLDNGPSGAAAEYMQFNQRGDMRGRSLDHAFRTHDGRTVDSTGAFLVGELERLDQTIHAPLAAVTWSRDIDLRTDVSLADEFSSFTLTTFGASGGVGGTHGGATGKARDGKAWVGKSTDQIVGISIDTGKLVFPLTPWAMELKYSILELESAAKMGRPIDAQKLAGLQLKQQMDTDEQVYVGDAILNVGGLLNNALVTNVSNVPNGAAASPLWVNKTPAEILKDVNEILQSGWSASGFAQMPERILIPPVQFGALSTQIISSAGTTSILKYLLENNIVKASTGRDIVIQPAKWATGFGAGGTDRMMAYTKSPRFVRFPMTQLQRTPIQYDSLYHKTTYYNRLGVVEVVYPETIVYRDGL